MRAVEEWIGKKSDAAIPPRVKLRIFLRFNGCCQCGCGRRIVSGEPWQADHVTALINGGQHRESNLQPLLTEHHKNKTKEDVAEKSVTYRKRLKHHGLKKPKGRPIPGSKRSGLRKKMDGTVVKR